MHSAKILILQTGHAAEPILSTCGDFNDFFIKHIRNQLGSVCEFDAFPICDIAESPKKPQEYQGIIVTGAAAMLEENLDWMQRSLDYTNRCLDSEIPLLGVCLGHQILGQACGAKVGPNPKGRQNGTANFTFENKPEIFKSLPDKFGIQISHRDIVLEDSPHFRILGASDHDKRHMIQAGLSAWGVQFHPEWDKKVSRMYIDLRRDILINEMGQDKFNEMCATLIETPHSTSILKYFVSYCLES